METIKKFVKWIIDEVVKFIKNYYSVFIISFLALMTVELLNRPSESIWEVISWLHTNTRAAVMNYVIYLNINLIFYLIIGRLNLANIAFFGCANILGLVNYFKLVEKGDNLVFWDFFNSLDAVKAVTETKLEITWQVVLVVGMIFLVALWQIKGHRKHQKGSLRLKLFLLAFVVLSSITVGVVFNDDLLESIYITNMDWNYDKNYKENGFILCYIMNLQDIVVEEPDDYSEETVLAAAEEAASIEIESTVDLEESPNIVVVMAESFSDISLANEGLSFDEEIMPNISSMNENVIKGNLVVSTFGGGTANSEYEFLSGNSMSYLPSGSVAYNSYIGDEDYTIVGTLKDNGYTTIAIHPYDREFYHRSDVYTTFGFDEFIAEDDFPEDAERKRGYIADTEVYDMIVSQYESKEEGETMFLFSVTMENHTPYTDESNGKVSVTYDSELYDSSKIDQVGVHARGVQDSDQLYADLVEYFSNVDEPTIVVMFGDHHPYVSNTVNRDTDNLDEVNKYKTQYIIWANYDLGVGSDYTDYTLDSSCLGALTLYYAGIDLPNYLEYTLYGAELLSGYNAYFVLDRDGNYYTYHDEMSEELSNYINTKKILQYDIMFGKQYSLEQMWYDTGGTSDETQIE